MTEPIKIEIELEAEEAERGADNLAQSLDRVTEATDNTATGAQAATQSHAQLANGLNQFQQRAAAAASQVQALATQFGGGTGAQAAGLIGRTFQASAALSQMGAVLGPAGSFTGAIIGAALPAIGELIAATDRQAEAHRRARQAVDDEAQSIRGLIEARREAEARQQEFMRQALGGASVEEGARAADLARAAEEDIARAERSLRAARERGNETRVRALERELSRLRQERFAGEAIAGAAATAAIETQETQSDEERAARRSAAAASAGSPEKDKAARVEARQQDEYNRMLAETAELYARAAEEARAVADAELAIENAAEERWEREQEIIEERKDAEADELDRVRERNEAMKDLYREQIESYQEVTGVVVGGITDTLVAIIAGQKSAEDAFRGLLASFLGYISEKAGLKAAEEAAEAIGAYARYDFGSGAQHTAAALAWGGLAIAAGVGAAVAAPPPPPARESPARGAGSRADRGERSGGGEVIINWNSPVVTAQTTAELGRTLQNTIGVAQTRFGR